MGKRYEGPETYGEAMRFLKGRDSRVFPGVRSTTFHKVEGWDCARYQREGVDGVAMEYHLTDVVTWYPDGDIIINTGGWHTVTTKSRLGAVCQTWQDDGDWFFEYNGMTYNFQDGAILKDDGSVIGATPTLITDWNAKFNEEIETKQQLVEKIQGLDLDATHKVWKTFRKHLRFLATHCIDEFIPTILGVDLVRDIVSFRMRNAA